MRIMKCPTCSASLSTNRLTGDRPQCPSCGQDLGKFLSIQDLRREILEVEDGLKIAISTLDRDISRTREMVSGQLERLHEHLNQIETLSVPDPAEISYSPADGFAAPPSEEIQPPSKSPEETATLEENPPPAPSPSPLPSPGDSEISAQPAEPVQSDIFFSPLVEAPAETSPKPGITIEPVALPLSPKLSETPETPETSYSQQTPAALSNEESGFACPNCGMPVGANADRCDQCNAPLFSSDSSSKDQTRWPPRRSQESSQPTRPASRRTMPSSRSHPPPPPDRRPFSLGWFEQIQGSFGGEEWEAIIGGNLLNKVGGLILAIGVALFLNYSYGSLGPAGRVALGYALGLGLLIGGLVAVRRSRFLVFARGLVGAGWAAIYFTSYAVHAIENAKLIEDPLIGMLLLCSVATAMIVHALTTRSEAITSLAYFMGFVTLLITPRTNFSLLATLPLAGSLLYVAYHFKWDRILVGGVVLTYGSYALALGDVAWRGPSPDAMVSGKAVLFCYWLMFEIFDLLGIARRHSQEPIARTLFPLNAVGFVGVALMHKPSGDPLALPHFLAMTAAAYFASTLARAWMRPPSSFSDSEESLERAIGGGYESAVSIMVLLLVPSLLLWFGGVRVVLLLLLLTEMLFLSGVRLKEAYLRALGAFVFEMAVLRVFYDFLQGGTRELWMITIHRFTPGAILTAIVGYGNRAFFRRFQGIPQDWSIGFAYSISATILIVLVLGKEVATVYLGTAWLIHALILLEIGARAGRKEFRGQAYSVGLLALTSLLINNGLAGETGSSRFGPWCGLGLSSAICAAWAWRYFHFPPLNLEDEERHFVRDVTTATATGCFVGLLWQILPVPVVAIGWGVVALALFEISALAGDSWLRKQAHLVAALAFFRLPIANFAMEEKTAGLSHRLLTVFPMAFLFQHIWFKLRSETSDSRLYLYPAPILIAALLRFELGLMTVVVGWGIMVAVLVWLGRFFRVPDLRWQGYALGLATFFRCWSTNFISPETVPLVADTYGRIVTGGFVIIAFYVTQFILPRSQKLAAESAVDPSLGAGDMQARVGVSLLATVLLTLLVYFEVSGGMFTVALGVEAVLLLLSGFGMRDRTLRYSGIFILLGCILKLMILDLRHLPTHYQIISFCLVGALLLAVSWFYSRYRDELKKYL